MPRRQRRSRKATAALRPNVGIQKLYQKRLDDLIKQMNASVTEWVRRAFKANEPKMTEAVAMDVMPADDLSETMEALADDWLHRFDDASERMADYFATSVQERTDATMRNILKRAGFTVRFRMTPAQVDVFKATVQANVALIKSIPSEYLTQVEGMVMRSVQAGRDLGTLSKELQTQFGVTRRRAALIARDQNNKATSAMQKARMLELGMHEAIWLHSHGGKQPRPKHVKASGQTFDVRKGMKVGDKGQWVMPGEEINCKCVYRMVVPGLS